MTYLYLISEGMQQPYEHDSKSCIILLFLMCSILWQVRWDFRCSYRVKAKKKVYVFGTGIWEENLTLCETKHTNYNRKI